MEINGYEIAFFTVTFLVPGFIISRVWNVLIDRDPRVHQPETVHEIEFLRWLALSIASIAPILVVVFLIDGARFTSPSAVWAYALEYRGWAGIGWFLLVFIWPVVIGTLTAMLYRIGWWIGPVESLRVGDKGKETNPPSAWDNQFKRATSGAYIFVILNDGNWIAGEFGPGSHASSDQRERDVYISTVHATSWDADLLDFDYQGGILIPSWKIQVIHFWNEPQKSQRSVSAPTDREESNL